MAQRDQRPRHSRHTSKILTQQGDSNAENERKDDDGTIQFIKQILCAQPAKSGNSTGPSFPNFDSKPLEQLLPPLTSSNEVDVQLYAIIAVILNQSVQSWYNRLTPDQDFVSEIVQIIAHCTRGVEERLRLVDLEEFLLDELPALAIAHVDGMSSGLENLQLMIG